MLDILLLVWERNTEEWIYHEFIKNVHSPPQLGFKPGIRRGAEYLLKCVVSFPFHECYSTCAVGEGGFSHNHQYPFVILLTEKWNCCGFCCVRSCGTMIQRELSLHRLCSSGRASTRTSLPMCSQSCLSWFMWYKQPWSLGGLCVLKANLGTCAKGSVPLGYPDSALFSRWAPRLKPPPALWASTKFCPMAAKLTGKWWSGSCSSMPSWTPG